MKTAIKLLLLEDNPADAALLRVRLEQEGFTLCLRRVDTRAGFEQALLAGDPDLIISDFTLPAFDGMQALAFARVQCPAVPFLFFSATLGEELAVASLKAGAADYVPKDRVAALAPAVRRALGEVEARRRREQADAVLQERERWFRALTESSLDVVTILDARGRFKYNSPSLEPALGFRPEALAGQRAAAWVHWRDRPTVRRAFCQAVRHPEQPVVFECRVRHRNGAWRDLEVHGQSRLSDPTIAGVVLNCRDRTEQRCTEAQRFRAQQMGCLGALARGLAHDLNNVLTPALLTADLLRAQVADPQARAMLDAVKISAVRGAELLRQVLHFPRGMHTAPLTPEPRAGDDHLGVPGSRPHPSTLQTLDALATTPPVGSASPPLGQGELILVAEGALAALEFHRLTLQSHKYQVLGALDGLEALHLFHEHKAHIHAVLTELTLPVLDGAALVQAMRRVEPGVKVLCVSGLPANAVPAREHLQVQAFLPKPFTAPQLLTTLAGLLQSQA